MSSWAVSTLVNSWKPGSAASRPSFFAKRTEAAAYIDVLLGCLNVGKLEAGSCSLQALTFP